MVIWITGISGAGKTTLCEAMKSLLKAQLPELVLLDGDIIRDIFGNDLSFEESDRVKQIKRIQSIAQELDRQDLVVLVAALYAHPELLKWNRQNFDDYFEVYLDAPTSLVESRDSKGLYAKARRGEMPNVVGLDIQWHAPATPDLRVDATKAGPPDQLALSVAQQIPRLAERLPAPIKGGSRE